MSSLLYSIDTLRELKGSMFKADNLLSTILCDIENPQYKEFIEEYEPQSFEDDGFGFTLLCLYFDKDKRGLISKSGYESCKTRHLYHATDNENDDTEIEVYLNGTMRTMFFTYCLDDTKKLQFLQGDLFFSDDECIEGISGTIIDTISDGQQTRIGLRMVAGRNVIFQKEDKILMAIYENGTYKPVARVMDSSGDVRGDATSYGGTNRIFRAYQKRDYSNFEFCALSQQEIDEVQQYVSMTLAMPNEIIDMATKRFDHANTLAAENGLPVADIGTDVDRYTIKTRSDMIAYRVKMKEAGAPN